MFEKGSGLWSQRGAGGHGEGDIERRPPPDPHSALCSPFILFLNY